MPASTTTPSGSAPSKQAAVTSRTATPALGPGPSQRLSRPGAAARRDRPTAVFREAVRAAKVGRHDIPHVGIELIRKYLDEVRHASPWPARRHQPSDSVSQTVSVNLTADQECNRRLSRQRPGPVGSGSKSGRFDPRVLFHRAKLHALFVCPVAKPGPDLRLKARAPGRVDWARF